MPPEQVEMGASVCLNVSRVAVIFARGTCFILCDAHTVQYVQSRHEHTSSNNNLLSLPRLFLRTADGGDHGEGKDLKPVTCIVQSIFKSHTFIYLFTQPCIIFTLQKKTARYC